MIENTSPPEEKTLSHDICLFSLRTDSVAFEVIPDDAIDNILILLKQRGAEIVNVEATEVNATFQTLDTCTETAKNIIQNLLQTAEDFNPETHFVKIGLHIIEETNLEGELILKHFDSPIAACNSADPNEIVITTELYDHLSPDIQKTCKVRDSSPDTNRPFYSLSQKRRAEKNGRRTAIIPSGQVNTDSLPCFYCGTSVHTSAACPSKPILNSTDYINKLGYIPLTRITEMFQENFQEMTRPLKKGNEEERFETIYNERYVTPSSIAFFSFYEISETFQIRSLRRLYINTLEDPKTQISGALRMGQDCLRVSRFSEAEEWFRKASIENPNDCRPVVSQGLLYMEQKDPKEALSQFRRALSFPLTEDQKAPIYLLHARMYEILDVLDEANEQVLKAIRAARGWKDAEYYHAVILVRLGNINAATDIIAKLAYRDPRYLLIAYLDPALNFAREELTEFLDSEMSHLRSRALESYANIKKNIEKYESWLNIEHKSQKRVYELYQKASSTLQNESISGIADIPDFENEVTELIKRSVLGRKRDLQKKIYRFSENPSAFLKYLDLYPYKYILSPKDFQTGKQFQSLYNEATNAVQFTTPESLKNAQNLLEELAKISKTVKSAHGRLETTKTFLFTCEYIFKMLRFFTITAFITASFFIIILILLQAVLSPSTLKSLAYISFFRYGLYSGVFVGIIATGIWVKKSLTGMMSKITKT